MKRYSARAKFEAEEKKIEILSAYNYRCIQCGGQAIFLAHRIAKTKNNIKRYGTAVIHHEKNLLPVCSNPRCNDACNIGGRPGDVEKLVREIQEELYVAV
jgi:hypothetical protein